jgi:ethanolamine utilization protein EutN
MRLGRVVGRLWCSVKDESLQGQKLLVIQPIDASGRDNGHELVALDAVGAGSGEVIYWCRGREASFAFRPKDVGTDASIVGIVDDFTRNQNESTGQGNTT